VCRQRRPAPQGKIKGRVRLNSIGLGYVAIREVNLSIAACRAYNNWVADFCRPCRNRLHGIAPVPMLGVEAAIIEMRRVVKSHDVKAVLVRPNPHGTRLLSDPANVASAQVWSRSACCLHHRRTPFALDGQDRRHRSNVGLRRWRRA
jgi:amidohydrolase family protein